MAAEAAVQRLEQDHAQQLQQQLHNVTQQLARTQEELAEAMNELATYKAQLTERLDERARLKTKVVDAVTQLKEFVQSRKGGVRRASVSSTPPPQRQLTFEQAADELGPLALSATEELTTLHGQTANMHAETARMYVEMQQLGEEIALLRQQTASASTTTTTRSSMVVVSPTTPSMTDTPFSGTTSGPLPNEQLLLLQLQLTQVQGDHAAVQQELVAMQERARTLETERDALRRQLAETQVSAQQQPSASSPSPIMLELSRMLEQLDQAHQDLARLQKEKLHATQELQTIRTDLAQEQQETVRVRQEREQLHKDTASARHQRQQIDEQLSQGQQELTSMTQHVTALEQRISELQQDLANEQQALAQTRSATTQAQQHLLNLQGSLQHATTQLDQATAQLEQTQRQQQQAASQLEQTSQQHQQATDQLAKTRQEQFQQLQIAQDELALARQELTSVQEQTVMTQRALAALNVKVAAQQDESAQIDSQRSRAHDDLAQAQRQLVDVKQDLTRLQAESWQQKQQEQLEIASVPLQLQTAHAQREHAEATASSLRVQLDKELQTATHLRADVQTMQHLLLQMQTSSRSALEHSQRTIDDLRGDLEKAQRQSSDTTTTGLNELQTQLDRTKTELAHSQTAASQAAAELEHAQAQRLSESAQLNRDLAAVQEAARQQAQRDADTIRRMQADVSTTMLQLNKVQADLVAAKATQLQVQSDVTTAQDDVVRRTAELTAATTQVDVHRGEVAILRSQLSQATSDLDNVRQQQDRLAQELAAERQKNRAVTEDSVALRTAQTRLQSDLVAQQAQVTALKQRESETDALHAQLNKALADMAVTSSASAAAIQSEAALKQAQRTVERLEEQNTRLQAELAFSQRECKELHDHAKSSAAQASQLQTDVARLRQELVASTQRDDVSATGQTADTRVWGAAVDTSEQLADVQAALQNEAQRNRELMLQLQSVKEQEISLLRQTHARAILAQAERLTAVIALLDQAVASQTVSQIEADNMISDLQQRLKFASDQLRNADRDRSRLRDELDHLQQQVQQRRTPYDTYSSGEARARLEPAWNSFRQVLAHNVQQLHALVDSVRVAATVRFPSGNAAIANILQLLTVLHGSADHLLSCSHAFANAVPNLDLISPDAYSSLAAALPRAPAAPSVDASTIANAAVAAIREELERLHPQEGSSSSLFSTTAPAPLSSMSQLQSQRNQLATAEAKVTYLTGLVKHLMGRLLRARKQSASLRSSGINDITTQPTNLRAEHLEHLLEDERRVHGSALAEAHRTESLLHEELSRLQRLLADTETKLHSSEHKRRKLEKQLLSLKRTALKAVQNIAGTSRSDPEPSAAAPRVSRSSTQAPPTNPVYLQLHDDLRRTNQANADALQQLRSRLDNQATAATDFIANQFESTHAQQQHQPQPAVPVPVDATLAGYLAELRETREQTYDTLDTATRLLQGSQRLPNMQPRRSAPPSDRFVDDAASLQDMLAAELRALQEAQQQADQLLRQANDMSAVGWSPSSSMRSQPSTSAASASQSPVRPVEPVAAPSSSSLVSSGTRAPVISSPSRYVARRPTGPSLPLAPNLQDQDQDPLQAVKQRLATLHQAFEELHVAAATMNSEDEIEELQ